MKYNRFLNRDPTSPVHSSGLVEQKDNMGSTAPDSFSSRKKRESLRQIVGSYRDAIIHSQTREGAERYRRASRFGGGNRSALRRAMASSRQSNTSQVSQAPQSPSQHTFREPPSRYRS